MENILFELYKKNFPYVVRNEDTARRILTDGHDKVIEEHIHGELAGVSVISGHTVLMLCVNEEHRNRGIGSRLLERSEEYVRSRGFDKINIGAGSDYLTPGVPIRGSNVDFFTKRGYIHSWGDDECFDMDMKLSDLTCTERVGDTINGVTYELAHISDMEECARCAKEAEEHFGQYYLNEALYREGGNECVLAAKENGIICGVIIIGVNTEGESMGSVGCTSVRPEYQHRRIATNMVKTATAYLKELGMTNGHLGYTYTGLDKLYGRAGYKVTEKYMMAEKSL